MMKTGMRLTVLVLCSLLLAGCSGKNQIVTADRVTLTVPGEYKNCTAEDYANGYTLAFQSNHGAVTVFKESRSSFVPYSLEEMDLNTYVQMLLEGYELKSTPQQMDGFLSFTFERDGSTYLTGIWADPEAFWMIQAGCPTEDYPNQEETFREILSQAQFAEFSGMN